MGAFLAGVPHEGAGAPAPVGAVMGACRRVQGKSMPRRGACPGQRPGWQLQGNAGTGASHHDTERGDNACRLEHQSRVVQEGDIEGEAHEEGMDGRAGGYEEAFIGVQASAAQEAHKPPPPGAGTGKAAGKDDAGRKVHHLHPMAMIAEERPAMATGQGRVDRDLPAVCLPSL